MTEAEQRAAVVAEARSWIGTRYHNCADVKGHGVDCGMLLVRVFCDLGLIEPFDPRPYPPDWHLHRDEERYLDFVRKFGGIVSTPNLGDVAMFRFGRCAAHGGIVTSASPLTIVHAYQPAGCVLEDEVDTVAALKKRMHSFYSYWSKQ